MDREESGRGSASALHAVARALDFTSPEETPPTYSMVSLPLDVSRLTEAFTTSKSVSFSPVKNSGFSGIEGEEIPQMMKRCARQFLAQMTPSSRESLGLSPIPVIPTPTIENPIEEIVLQAYRGIVSRQRILQCFIREELEKYYKLPAGTLNDIEICLAGKDADPRSQEVDFLDYRHGRVYIKLEGAPDLAEILYSPIINMLETLLALDDCKTLFRGVSEQFITSTIKSIKELKDFANQRFLQGITLNSLNERMLLANTLSSYGIKLDLISHIISLPRDILKSELMKNLSPTSVPFEGLPDSWKEEEEEEEEEKELSAAHP